MIPEGYYITARNDRMGSGSGVMMIARQSLKGKPEGCSNFILPEKSEMIAFILQNCVAICSDIQLSTLVSQMKLLKEKVQNEQQMQQPLL